MAVTLGACAAGDPVEGILPETSQEPIIGSTETKGYSHVAGLLAFTPGEDGASLCTSTLISPTVLLTAAHCVDPAVVGAGKTFEARFHPDLRNTPADLKVKVKEVHWDTAFSKDNLTNGHDIAVAILEKPAPAGITPMAWAKAEPPKSLEGTQVLAVGYGLNKGNDQTGESAGIKREAMIPLNTIGNPTLGIGKFGLNICSGDSGGPIIAKIDGVDTIIGVNSYGIIFCIGSSNATNVAVYKDFVAKYADSGPTCTPKCGDCGGDGCGGTCPDTCGDGETCSNDTCVPSGGSGCPNESEGNDDAPQADELCDGDAVLGSISSASDIDWYSFDIKPSTTYTVLLDNVDAKYEFVLWKKNSAGGLAKVGDGRAAGGTKLISRRTSTGGVYYVQVRGVNGPSASNQYGLYVIK